MSCTLEKVMRIYNDETGDYVEVREDSDGLELIEIIQSENKARVVLTMEQAALLRGAITEVCDHIESRRKT